MQLLICSSLIPPEVNSSTPKRRKLNQETKRSHKTLIMKFHIYHIHSTRYHTTMTIPNFKNNNKK